MSFESDTTESLARIEEKVDGQGERIMNLEHTVDGNGSVGLKIDVDRLKGESDRRKENRNLIYGFISLLVASNVGLIIALVVMLAKLFSKA